MGAWSRSGAARAALATALGSVLLLAGLAPASAADGPRTLRSAALTLTFADPARGPAGNADRLDHLSWVDSSGARSGDLAAHGGTACGDTLESWGQAYAYPEGTQPIPVAAGTLASWTAYASGNGGTALTRGGSCFGTQPVATTSYSVYPGPLNARRNAYRVGRTIAFGATPVSYASEGVRFYVPRMPYATYRTVLYPSTSGGLRTTSAEGCAADCPVADWAGRWFADDSALGKGRGLLVLRDPASTAPALLAVNWDSASGSNLTSVVLREPAAGWVGRVTETEWLCFYDRLSWPPPTRALTLPLGCAVPS